MLIFNYLIGNNCPKLRNGLLGSYFHKLTLGSDCLEICFWAVAFKIFWLINTTNIPVACKPSFKYSSVYTVPLSFLLNLSFVCTLLTVTTQKANAGSPSISFHLADEDDVTNIRSFDQCIWLYLSCYKAL